jgi:glucose-1-phosphate adenylyltransferase
MNDTLAMVLAGGRVDELLALTEKRPKAAVPIFGIYRFIDFVLTNMMHSGMKNVGILSQYRPYGLMRHVGSGEHWDFLGRSRSIRILPPYKGLKESDWYKGTADAVYQNIAFLEEFKPADVLLASADHVYSMDYGPLIAFHRGKHADATACFTRVRSRTKRFGYGVLDRGGTVVRYLEKPDSPPSELVSMTVYVFRTGVLVDLLKDNAREQSHEFGHDILPKLVQDKRLFGYGFRGTWAYLRTARSYFNIHKGLLSKKIHLEDWQVRTNLLERNTNGERVPARINGRVRNSIVSEGCIIDGAVTNSVLSPGVVVQKGGQVQDSIIFHDCTIKSGSTVRRSIIDKDSVIEEECEIGTWGDTIPSGEFSDLLDCGLVIMGRNTRIPSRTKIGSNSVIYSGAEIKETVIQPGSTLR